MRESERQQRIAIEQLEMARARRMAMEEEVRYGKVDWRCMSIFSLTC